MKVSGSATLHASPEQVWAALNDPAVLVRTIPGCERLEAVGPDAYRMTVTAGVASIKGTYLGDVALSDHEPHSAFRLKASGAGAPGTVSADVVVRLASDAPGTTTLTYDADAVVGGPVGGVGQRVLTSVAKKTAGEFFAAVDRALAEPPSGGVPAAPAPDGTPAAPAPAPGSPAVFERPDAGRRVDVTVRDQLPAAAAGAVVGALAALVGVVVGWRLGRR